jgi:gluconate 2-dehydrogenase gamma chain
MPEAPARRAFLRAAAAAGAAWALSEVVGLEAAIAAAQSRRAETLTDAQARCLDAAVDRILPAVDGRPGAREAGAMYFIDRALGTFQSTQRPAYVKGLRDLDRRAARLTPGAAFAALTPAQQDDVLRAIEKTAFFQMLRVDTIVGTLALPTWGGNRDHAGWRMLGLDHRPIHQPPFGYYDAEAQKGG